MKAVMFSLALGLVVGCGKKEETQLQGQTKDPENPAVLNLGKIESPEILAKRTLDALSKNDYPALAKLGFESLPKEALIETSLNIGNPLTQDNIKKTAQRLGITEQQARDQISDKRLKERARMEGGFQEGIKQVSNKRKASFEKVISDGKKQANIEWGKVSFVRLEGEPWEEKGVKGGDFFIILAYDGSEFKIKLDDCILHPKHGWFIMHGPDWHGTNEEAPPNPDEPEPIDGAKKPGTVLWQFETGGQVYSSPAIGSDGTVYVGSWDNKLYAINGKTGVKLWEFETGGIVESSLAVSTDGTVYFGSGVPDNKVYALNGRNGAKKWEFKTKFNGQVRSSPAIGFDGTVYVGADDGNVYALDGQSGAKKWEFETGHNVRSSPAIGSDDTVYLSSNDNKVYGLDRKSGVKKWEFETGGSVVSSPANGPNDTVYVGSNDNKLYAINGKSGVKLWEFETGDDVTSSPAIGSDGTVYVGSWDRKIYAINGKTGVKLWEFETGGIVDSSPAIGSDDTVYVGSNDNKLYAINGKTGVKLWEFETGGLVRSSPAIASDGTVYVGSNDKKLYAIKTASKGIAKSPWPMRGQNPQHTGRAPKKE